MDLLNKLILVRGLPGSGKSTWAMEQQTRTFFSAHLEADMFHMDRGVYKFDGERVHLAHNWCFETTKVFLNNGMSVYVSNTFTRIKEMQRYLELARELDIPLQVVKMVGSFGSVHNVPDSVIEAMHKRWEDYPGEIVIGEKNEEIVCV